MRRGWWQGWDGSGKLGGENPLERLEPFGQIAGERDVHIDGNVVVAFVVDDHDFDFRRSRRRVGHEQPFLYYNARHGKTDP